MSRRARRSGAPTCRDCGRPIAWFKSPFTSSAWRTFDNRPVDGRHHVGPAAYPVEALQAYRLDDLVTELMGRYACSDEDARDHAYAMRWFVLHSTTCPAAPTRPQGAAR